MSTQEVTQEETQETQVLQEVTQANPEEGTRLRNTWKLRRLAKQENMHESLAKAANLLLELRDAQAIPAGQAERIGKCIFVTFPNSLSRAEHKALRVVVVDGRRLHRNPFRGSGAYILTPYSMKKKDKEAVLRAPSLDALREKYGSDSIF